MKYSFDLSYLKDLYYQPFFFLQSIAPGLTLKIFPFTTIEYLILIYSSNFALFSHLFYEIADLSTKIKKKSWQSLC